jgi:hypothetical protein
VDFGAESGCALLIDARTGEERAMAVHSYSGLENYLCLFWFTLTFRESHGAG